MCEAQLDRREEETAADVVRLLRDRIVASTFIATDAGVTDPATPVCAVAHDRAAELGRTMDAKLVRPPADRPKLELGQVATSHPERARARQDPPARVLTFRRRVSIRVGGALECRASLAVWGLAKIGVRVGVWARLWVGWLTNALRRGGRRSGPRRALPRLARARTRPPDTPSRSFARLEPGLGCSLMLCSARMIEMSASWSVRM